MPPVSQIRLYIIEQHPIVCGALVKRLSAEQSLVLVGAATELAQGVEAAQGLKPDVVLLGSRNKGRGDTFATIGAIARLVGPGLPDVILLAAYLDDREREQALTAGASRYLLKDIDTAGLVREILAVAAARLINS